MAPSVSSFWESSWSAMQKRVYFFNRSTGQAQWQTPTGAPTQLQEPAVAAADPKAALALKAVGPLPKGWAAAWDAQYGRVYFYQVGSSGERTWFKPFFPEEELARVKIQKRREEDAKSVAQKTLAAKEHILLRQPARAPTSRDLIAGRVPWDALTFLHRMVDARAAVNSNRFVTSLNREVFESNLKMVAAPFITPEDYLDWREKLELEGSRDDRAKWELRVSKARSKFGLRIPESVRVKYVACAAAIASHGCQEFDEDPKVVFWQLTTPAHRPTGQYDDDRTLANPFESMVDVIYHLAGTRHGEDGIVAVCPSTGHGPAGFEAPSSAEQELAAGDYVEGEEGWEADLCRRIPSLWPSLVRGMADWRQLPESLHRQWPLPFPMSEPPLYPYGRAANRKDPQSRCYDGVYTPGVDVARGPEKDGFPLLDKDNRRPVNILSITPPVRGATDKKEAGRLLRGSVVTMLAGPKVMDAANTILVLPAFGCGAPWNNDARDIASMFAQAIKGGVACAGDDERRDAQPFLKLGRLYKEIHFVFPPPHTENVGDLQERISELHVFRKVFRARKYQIAFDLGDPVLAASGLV